VTVGFARKINRGTHLTDRVWWCYQIVMPAAHHTIARDFPAKTRRALLKRGIVITGATVIPGSGPLPFASGSRGYCLDNNGQHQIRSYSEVEGLV
jgi:hypothetical protein